MSCDGAPVGLVRCDRSAVERAKWVIRVLVACTSLTPFMSEVDATVTRSERAFLLSGQRWKVFGDHWHWEFPGRRQPTGGCRNKERLIRDARSFR